jgi:hypothetical protein
MDDLLIKKLIECENKRNDITDEKLIEANIKLVDENAIIKKELKKCYGIIDEITNYIENLPFNDLSPIEVKVIYKIIKGDKD